MIILDYSHIRCTLKRLVNKMAEKSKNDATVNILTALGTSQLNMDDAAKADMYARLIDSAKEGDDALLDRIFGKKNPQMYVTLLMSLIVLIIVSIFTWVFRENLDFVKFVWNIAIPAITLLWGYAFGKSQNK